MSDFNPEERPYEIDLTTRHPDAIAWEFFGGPLDGQTRYLPPNDQVFFVLWGTNAPIGRRNAYQCEYRPRSVADELNKVMRWAPIADFARGPQP